MAVKTTSENSDISESCVSIIHHNTSCCTNNTTTQQHGGNNKNFDHMITKCYNKNACGTKLQCGRVTGIKKSTIGGLSN